MIETPRPPSSPTTLPPSATSSPSAPTTSSATPCAPTAATTRWATSTRSTSRPSCAPSSASSRRATRLASWSVCAARLRPIRCSSRCCSPSAWAKVLRLRAVHPAHPSHHLRVEQGRRRRLTEKVMQLKTATEVKAHAAGRCPLGHSPASCSEPNEAPQVTWPGAPLCLRVTAGAGLAWEDDVKCVGRDLHVKVRAADLLAVCLAGRLALKVQREGAAAPEPHHRRTRVAAEPGKS